MTQHHAIRFVIEIEVSDIEGFKAHAAAATAISEGEPGTLIYDWYLDESTGKARLYEAYESFEALGVHAPGRVFTEVAPKLLQTCKFTRVDVFGAPPEVVRKGIAAVAPPTFWGAPFAAVSG